MIQFSAAQQAAITAAAKQQATEILIQRQVEQLLGDVQASPAATAEPVSGPIAIDGVELSGVVSGEFSAGFPADSGAVLPSETGYRTIRPVPSLTTENPVTTAPLNQQGGYVSTPPPPFSVAPVLSPPAVVAGVSGSPGAAVGLDALAVDRSLAAALELLEPQEAWAPSTRGEYHGLIRRWQEYHDGPGPMVHEITEEMLLAFLAAVANWKTHRTRNKQLTYLTKILQAVAPKTGRTKYGMRQGRAWLQEVPYVRLPKKARPTTTQTWRLDNVTVDDIARMYCVAGQMRDALRWQTLLVMVWLFGPRRADLLLMPWAAMDWSRKTLSYIETKGGHPVGPLPIPDYLLAHLTACRKQDWPHSILNFTRNDVRKGTNNVYPTLYRIYEQAEVAVPRDKADRRIPLHGLRAACITNWKGHAPGLQRFVTGHQHGSDVSDENYARIGGQMAEQIQTLPVPDEFRQGPGATKRVRRRRGLNRRRRSTPTVTATGDTESARLLAEA